MIDSNSPLIKLSTIGRFSINDLHNKIIIKQKNILGIIKNILILSFIIFIIAFQAYFKGIQLPDLEKNPTAIIGVIGLPYIIYIFVNNIFILSKNKQELTIDIEKRLIIHNGYQLEAKQINFAELGKTYTSKSYKYDIIIYVKSGIPGSNREMSDTEKLLTSERIFLPTSHTKNFMLLIINEINKLTSNGKIIEDKTDLHEILSKVYLLFIISLWTFLAYIFIKYG